MDAKEKNQSIKHMEIVIRDYTIYGAELTIDAIQVINMQKDMGNEVYQYVKSGGTMKTLRSGRFLPGTKMGLQ